MKNTEKEENSAADSIFYFLDPRFCSRGFTLVEVLVVLAITSFLAGMVLTYSSVGRSQVALYVESAKLAQVAFRAKSLAIATYNNPDTPCGYGLRVDAPAKSYSLFSYRPASCSSVSLGPVDLNDPGYRTIETFSLPKEIDFATDGAADLDFVLFVPPDPKTYIWTEGQAVGPAQDATGEVALRAAGSDNIMRVKVSPAGQVSF